MNKEIENKLKDVKIEDVLEYFNVHDILDNMRSYDIAEHCDNLVLTCIDDDTLIDALSDWYCVLDKFSIEELAEYLDIHGWSVLKNYENDEMLKVIKHVCRYLQPKGYIDKEDAKKLLCDYIDTWMVGSI